MCILTAYLRNVTRKKAAQYVSRKKPHPGIGASYVFQDGAPTARDNCLIAITVKGYYSKPAADPGAAASDKNDVAACFLWCSS
jgi:hypothetical protein